MVGFDLATAAAGRFMTLARRHRSAVGSANIRKGLGRQAEVRADIGTPYAPTSSR
jgi:hypothetical protein